MSAAVTLVEERRSTTSCMARMLASVVTRTRALIRRDALACRSCDARSVAITARESHVRPQSAVSGCDVGVRLSLAARAQLLHGTLARANGRDARGRACGCVCLVRGGVLLLLAEHIGHLHLLSVLNGRVGAERLPYRNHREISGILEQSRGSARHLCDE